MNNDSIKLVKDAYNILDEKKAEDIKILDIRNISVIADFFIIAHGNNKNHVQALIDHVEDNLSNIGYEIKQKEGYSTAKWVLLDYNYIIIHIFDKENRFFYDLERIWSDGKELQLEEINDIKIE